MRGYLAIGLLVLLGACNTRPRLESEGQVGVKILSEEERGTAEYGTVLEYNLEGRAYTTFFLIQPGQGTFSVASPDTAQGSGIHEMSQPMLMDMALARHFGKNMVSGEAYIHGVASRWPVSIRDARDAVIAASHVHEIRDITRVLDSVLVGHEDRAGFGVSDGSVFIAPGEDLALLARECGGHVILVGYTQAGCPTGAMGAVTAHE